MESNGERHTCGYYESSTEPEALQEVALVDMLCWKVQGSYKRFTRMETHELQHKIKMSTIDNIFENC